MYACRAYSLDVISNQRCFINNNLILESYGFFGVLEWYNTKMQNKYS